MEKIMNTYLRAEEQLEKIKKKEEDEITKVREKYRQETAKLFLIHSTCSEQLQLFSLQHKNILKNEQKKIVLGSGCIEFHPCPPRLSKSPNLSWDMILSRMREENISFIQTEHKVNEEKILRESSSPSVQDMMKNLGLQIHQDEYIEIKPLEKENLSSNQKISTKTHHEHLQG
ncbi:MAG: host-nuclease inhibitor Gam family protein [Cytophagales bacterium]|nr:host-nuclease inhibitor Gam family protein [Cytophagales bacterium]